MKQIKYLFTIAFIILGSSICSTAQELAQGLSQAEKQFNPKSEGKALGLSLMGTFLPIAAGWTILAVNQADEEPPLAIALLISGPVIGPSLGYFYGAPTLSNLKGLLIRSAAVGVAIWIVESDESNDYGGSLPSSANVKRSASLAPFFAITIGSVVVLVSAVNDIVKVKKRVREHNRKLLFKNSWNIMPKYFAKSGAGGVEIKIKF